MMPELSVALVIRVSGGEHFETAPCTHTGDLQTGLQAADADDLEPCHCTRAFTHPFSLPDVSRFGVRLPQ
ncbi:MAG TPA: hypothetical protein VFV96_01470 [Verrucomicrobiae bacterium]|nr:hypothetical protein [Verrucomicrobiae bacterium]